MPSASYHLTIPSSTEHLEDVRTFVERHAVEAGFGEDAVTQLKLAVDEACANVIEHAYGGDARHEIGIAIDIEPDRFTIRIRDQGKGFDPERYIEPDIFAFAHKRRSGGFGVALMRRLMDDVQYATSDGTNECCLVKRREAARNNGL